MSQLSDSEITLAIVGDVMLGRLANEALAANGSAYPWGDTLPLLRRSDLSIANLECVIASADRPLQPTPKAFHFRADPVAADALKLAGFAAVGLANNHVLDFGVAGLFDTVHHLDAAGIVHCGAGRDLGAAGIPALIEAKGLRVAIASFTDNEPGWAATPLRPGVNYLPISLERPFFSRLQQMIAAGRQRADVVVCSAHWGPNMRQRPSLSFRAFARAAIEAGADIFIGHSAHIFQGVELYHGKPIIYDAGDFVDDYAVDPTLRNDLSLLFFVRVGKEGVSSLEAVPVRIDRCQVNVAEGADRAEIYQRLEQLSGEMGTAIERVAGGFRFARQISWNE